MSQVRVFKCNPKLLPKLIDELETWLLGENFKCQTLTTEEGFLLIQTEKRGGWRKIVGMSTALNIIFKPVNDLVNVEIGAGRWLDKAAAGAISMVVLWPLLVTAGIGAVQQFGMPDKIYGRIEYLLRIIKLPDEKTDNTNDAVESSDNEQLSNNKVEQDGENEIIDQEELTDN